MIFLARKPVNENAMKALAEMKLEIANELGYDPSKGNAAGGMTKNLAKIGEKQFGEEDRDIFYPI